MKKILGTLLAGVLLSLSITAPADAKVAFHKRPPGCGWFRPYPGIEAICKANHRAGSRWINVPTVTGPLAKYCWELPGPTPSRTVIYCP